jgi:hypothetical protein
MSAIQVIDAIGLQPVTLEGLKLRLHVAGFSVPNLQSIVDGLLLVGRVKIAYHERKDCLWYVLSEAYPDLSNIAKRSDRKIAKLNKNPGTFRLTSFTPPKQKRIFRFDLEKEVLKAIDHDGPTTLQILNRMRKNLTLNDFELNFFEVKDKLNELAAKGQVGVLKATETTAGGWLIPRKPRMKV